LGRMRGVSCWLEELGLAELAELGELALAGCVGLRAREGSASEEGGRSTFQQWVDGRRVQPLARFTYWAVTYRIDLVVLVGTSTTAVVRVVRVVRVVYKGCRHVGE
jgi:hypothetical protein